jgi:hypothetical protein
MVINLTSVATTTKTQAACATIINLFSAATGRVTADGTFQVITPRPNSPFALVIASSDVDFDFAILHAARWIEERKR